MTKISKKAAYPIKKPVKSDYFIGSDSEDFGRTVNFDFKDATAVINELNGQSVIGYQFKTASDVLVGVLEEAEFYSLGNETTISDITKLYVNKYTKNSLNLTNLYNYLLVNSGDFLFKLQGTDPNVYVYFNLASIENHSDYYIFNVTLYKGNAVLPELINFGEYFFNFELKSTGGGVGTDIIDRIVVLENQTDVSNVFVEMQNFSFIGNVLTIYLGWIWKLLGVTYSNVASVNFTIPYCTTGKTRLVYVVPNNTNGFDVISGEETLGIRVAPQLPIHGLYVTFFIVTDSSIGTPQTPNTSNTPTLQQVTDIGYSLTNEIWFFNKRNSKCLGIQSERILFHKVLSGEDVWNSVFHDNTTESYNIQLPNKLGGAEQTFAMVSDIPEAQDLTDIQNQITAINILLASDNINLDNVQEIVDAIETVQTSLATILVNDLTTGGVTKALTAQMGVTIKGLIDALALVVADKANINSPSLTGTPNAPTAAAGTSTAQIATTAFVMNSGLNRTLLLDKTSTIYNAVSTGQQIIKTWTIPANTIPSDCILKLTIKTSRLLGSGNPFMGLFINGSAGWLNGVNGTVARRNIIINDINYDYHHASGTFIDDIISPADYSTFPLNRAIANTLTLNMNCDVTGNIFKFYYIMIEIVKQ